MYVCLGSSLCIHIHSVCAHACVCMHLHLCIEGPRLTSGFFFNMSPFYSLNPELTNTAGLVSKTLDCSAGISGRPPVPQWQVHGLWNTSSSSSCLSSKHISQGAISQCFYSCISLVLSLNMEPPYNLAIPLLGTPLRSENLYLQRYLYIKLARWLTG